MSEAALDLFIDCICDSGTPSIDCGCGRLNFASGEQSCESEEDIAKWREKAEKEPDKFIEHDEDSVSFGTFEGSILVWGCKCNERLARYEQFIWEHREKIIRYIKARTKRDLEKAGRLAEQMTEL